MAVGNQYGEGWGPVGVSDARLKGWEPLRVAAPLGSVAQVISTDERVVGAGHLRDMVLIVAVEITTPSGESWRYDAELSRPGRQSIWDFTDLASYLDEVAGGAVDDDWRDALEPRAFDPKASLRAGSGPLLTPLQFLQALDAVDEWRALGLDAEGEERSSISHGRLRSALNTAFLAGKRIAEAEMASQIQRAKVADAALRRIEDSRKWWPSGQAWAQQLIAEWPANEKLSLAALAERMWDGWASGPLAKTTARLKVRTLETDILPQWRDGGAIRLSRETGGP